MFDPITIGAGIIGGTSLLGSWLASEEQAGATEQAAGVSAAASDVSAAASDRAAALQREMWQKGLELQQPFYDVGLGALPDLQKAIQGGYDFQESPAAKYAFTTGGRELMRGLGARGLAGSGLAPVKLAELKSGIYASDYDKQIARLSGLVDIGRGTASGLSALGQQYGTTAGNIYVGAGENAANAGENAARAALAQGRNQASLYQGLGQIPMNLASLYMMGGGSFGSGTTPTAYPQLAASTRY